MSSFSGFPESFAAPETCPHVWEPISMVFETQWLDERGGVRVRQPDLEEAQTYFICRGCASHTYMTTQWLGVRMYGSQDAIPEKERGRQNNSINRGPWHVSMTDEDEDGEG
jgi:hypothetical protein